MDVRLNHAAIREFLYSPQGPAFREVERYTRLVANRARQLVGVDSGRLRSSIQHTVTVEGTRIIGRVGTRLEYGLYHHEGTGIHGPRRRVITPKRSTVLVFTPKGSNNVVFARSVQGSRPNPFLVRALMEMVPWPVDTDISGERNRTRRS